ncbi:MAG: VOC family protein [Burkholderiaceae bacterium]|nr:VOC family protein [Burkholderiaceae bacterium]
MNKITPFLWFDHQAEEAANFYVSVFKNSSISNVMRAGEKVMGVNFTLEGQAFLSLNGGPLYPFTPAISLYVNCETQAEVDTLWTRLSADPASERCGWLKDKYGLSWQIIPSALPQLLQDPDRAKANRVIQAMMQMKKIDVDALRAAAQSQ